MSVLVMVSKRQAAPLHWKGACTFAYEAGLSAADLNLTIATLLARVYDWRDTIDNFITPVIGAGDIKAAFDNATVKTLIAALRARKTHPRLIVAVSVEMLSLQVQPTFENLEFTSWVPWTKCIRQGGVESTFTWNFDFWVVHVNATPSLVLQWTWNCSEFQCHCDTSVVVGEPVHCGQEHW